jgi:hypothetical protein
MSMLQRAELIQRLMSKLQSFSEKETKMEMSIKTQDGRELYIVGGEIETGLEIYEIVDGSRVDLTDGEYILSDGKTIIVESNTIKSIKEVEPAEAEVEIEVEPSVVELCGDSVLMEKEMEKEKEKEKEKEEMMEDPRIGELESKVADMEKQMMDLLFIVEETMKKHDKMSEKVNKISKEPAESAFIQKPTEFNSDTTDKSERIKRIMELAKSK